MSCTIFLATFVTAGPSIMIPNITVTAGVAWTSVATLYASIMAARLVTGWGAGAVEVLVPLTIADIFFLHERGTMTMVCVSLKRLSV